MRRTQISTVLIIEEAVVICIVELGDTMRVIKR